MKGRSQGGYVTAELAAALPVLVALLLAGMFAVTAVTVKVQCVDAAREAVLAHSRGEDGALAAKHHLPRGGQVTMSTKGDTVAAQVSAEVDPGGALLPAMTVSSRATAAAEPGVTGTSGETS